MNLEVAMLRREGFTWPQIKRKLEAETGTEVDLKKLHKSYKTQLKKAAFKLEANEELDRLLSELNDLKIQAINQWYASLKPVEKVKKEYVVKGGVTLKVREITEALTSTGDPKYLALWLKAISEEKELLGLTRPDVIINNNSFNINTNYEDDHGVQLPPINSEDQIDEIDFSQYEVVQ